MAQNHTHGSGAPKDRKPCPIMDFTYNSINQDSVLLAPFQAMQFGHALHRILQQLAYCNPAFGPPQLAKVDMADDSYCIPLSTNAALQLTVSLPSDGASDPLLGIPLSLPMGWCLSPPFFCTFNEMCANLTNTVHVPHLIHAFPDAVVPQQPLPLSPSYRPQVCLPYNPQFMWMISCYLPNDMAT